MVQTIELEMGAEQGRHRHHHHDKEDSGSQPATPQDSKGEQVLSGGWFIIIIAHY